MLLEYFNNLNFFRVFFLICVLVYQKKFHNFLSCYFNFLTGDEDKIELQKIVNKLPDRYSGSSNVGLKICKDDKNWQEYKTLYSNSSRSDVFDHLSKDLESDVSISNLFSEAEKLDLIICSNTNII